MIDACLILAGGRGERAWPLTATRPKPLLPLPGDETIVSRLVRQAKRLTRDVYVLVPPGKSALFRKVLGDDVVIVEQDYSKGYGTGVALLSLFERVGNAERLLILYGDLVIDDYVFTSVAQKVNQGQYILAFRTRRDGHRYGVIVEEDGKLKRVIEKPGWTGEILVNAGIYILSFDDVMSALEDMGTSERGEVELTDAINAMASHREINVIEIPEGSVIDTGTWWDYLVAARTVLKWMLRDRVCKPLKPGSVILYDSVVCGYEPRVKQPVILEGPIWLGRDVELGPFTRLRAYTIIFNNAEIGAFVEVKASVVLEGVKSHHHAYIGDSVIGEYSNIAAGTVIANLRHDGSIVKSCAKGRLYETGLRKLGAVLGARVKTGVNTSILPGTRIGPCTWIEPGSVVKGDVPACSFYRRDGSITILDPRIETVRECCQRIEFGRGAGLCVKSLG